MARKFFVSALLVLWASCSFAAVTPEQAASDQRIAPYLLSTKRTGAILLPGRYMQTKELRQRTGGEKILAPTSLILEITALNPEQNTYSVNADLWGNDELFPMYTALDFSGQVPIIRTYMKDEDDEDYELIAEDYAIVMSDGEKHIWLFGSTETGEIRYMYPIDKSFFPEGWYSGTWKGSSGTTYTFADDGQAKINGQTVGKYIVSDNRIIITRNDGTKQPLYAALNTENNTLVITFTGEDDMTAEIFTRSEEKKAPASIFTHPAKTKTPEMPAEFPEMPKVSMPKPALNIDGVWGAYVNNQQLIMQFKGNQYFGWINGQPSEMGIISIEGSTATGTNNHGVNFTTELELDPSGNALTMTFQNGNSITYQRLQ